MGILDDEEEDKKTSPHVTFRCPPELYARLERVVAETGKKRSKVLVRLLAFALDAVERETASEHKKPKK